MSTSNFPSFTLGQTFPVLLTHVDPDERGHCFCHVWINVGNRSREMTMNEISACSEKLEVVAEEELLTGFNRIFALKNEVSCFNFRVMVNVCSSPPPPPSWVQKVKFRAYSSQ